MTEAAGSPFGVVQHFHRLPDDLAVSRDHHLADTLPVIDGKRFGREVYQDYADLAAIVRIDSTRRVQQCDAILQCQAATGAHLCLIAFRQRVSKLPVPPDLHECPFLPTAESRIPAADGVTYL